MKPSYPWQPQGQTRPERFDPMGTLTVPSVRRPMPGRNVPADLLVIGNGIAGSVAAMETRRYAPNARIVVVTEQGHPTINTPALKQFGAGRLELGQLLAHAEGTPERLGIEIVPRRAVTLDTRGHHVRLADGSAIAYHHLLLATGTRTKHLPGELPGHDLDGVMTLHTLHDYLDLHRRLPDISSVVVIGGGYHAADIATMLRQRRLKVTWLIRDRGLLPRQLDAAASDLLLRQARRRGIDVRVETAVTGIAGRRGAAEGVVTSDGVFIPCDLVLAAIGTQPDIALAYGTPIQAKPGRGVRVNEWLQTTAPDVYAAGAIAAVLDPQLTQHTTRDLWYFALQQGRLAAAAIAGVPVSEQAWQAATGNFWHATQFDGLNVLVAGAPMLAQRDHPDNEVLINAASGYFRRIVVRHGHLVGYLAIGGTPPPGLALKRLMDERIDIEEIKRRLLTDDFDVRAFFTQRHLRALETGRLAGVPQRVAAPSRQLPRPGHIQSA